VAAVAGGGEQRRRVKNQKQGKEKRAQQRMGLGEKRRGCWCGTPVDGDGGLPGRG